MWVFDQLCRSYRLSKSYPVFWEKDRLLSGTLSEREELHSCVCNEASLVKRVGLTDCPLFERRGPV